MTITNTRKKHMKKSILEDRFLAEAAVLDGQIVKIAATEGMVEPCAANENPIGIAVNGVTAAQIAAYDAVTQGGDIQSVEVVVMLIGIAPVLAGYAVAMNAWVISDANGRIVTATGDGTDNIIGICLNATAADGDNTHIQIHRSPAVD